MSALNTPKHNLATTTYGKLNPRVGRAEHAPDRGEGGGIATECETAVRAGIHAHRCGLELLLEASRRAQLQVATELQCTN